jgi:hypothetical protein
MKVKRKTFFLAPIEDYAGFLTHKQLIGRFLAPIEDYAGFLTHKQLIGRRETTDLVGLQRF